MISPGRGLSRIQVSRLADGRLVERKDVVTVEEPLEIRVEFSRNGARETCAVSVTMRTPGNDFELAAGFLYGEGLLLAHQATKNFPRGGTGSVWFLRLGRIRLRPGLTG